MVVQYKFGECTLDLHTRELYHLTEVIQLRPLPFRLLTYLIKKFKVVVTREELRREVWRNTWGVTDSTIDTCIRYVRKAIHDTKHSIIATHRGEGYCFTAIVEEVCQRAGSAQIVEKESNQATRTPEQIICASSSGTASPQPASVIDRCVNLLLGIAIGDAFGAGYAGLSPAEVMQQFTSTQYHVPPHRKTRQHRGHYSDDTQMSLAVAEALCAGSPFDTIMLATFFYEAYHRDKRSGYSSKTKESLEQSTVGGFIKHPRRAVTIGAAMRAVPLGVLPEVGTIIEYARINAETTHRTSEAIASSVAVALAAHYFFYDCGPVKDVFTFCLEHMTGDLHIPTKFLSLARMTTLESCNLQLLGWDRNRGLDINAIEMAAAAILLAMYTMRPEELLRRAVHFGGATDTVASLALGLYAARASLESLPSFLFDRLENGPYGRDYLIETGKRLATMCPMAVTVKNDQLLHPLDGIDTPIDPVYLVELMRRLMRKMPYHPDDLLVAVSPLGGLLACAAATSTGLPFRVVTHVKVAGSQDSLAFRDSEGRMMYLYGTPPRGRVILVDAAITTGTRVCQWIKKLTSKGWNVSGVVVLMESQCHRARQKLEKQQITLVSHTVHTQL